MLNNNKLFKSTLFWLIVSHFIPIVAIITGISVSLLPISNKILIASIIVIATIIINTISIIYFFKRLYQISKIINVNLWYALLLLIPLYGPLLIGAIFLEPLKNKIDKENHGQEYISTLEISKKSIYQSIEIIKKEYKKYIWYIYSNLVLGVIVAIDVYLATLIKKNSSSLLSIVNILLSIFIALSFALINIYLVVFIYNKIINKKYLKPKENIKKSISLIWISFLSSLYSNGPLIITFILIGIGIGLAYYQKLTLSSNISMILIILGILILFFSIIWSIYASIKIKFSSILLFDKDKKGKESIKSSIKITQNKWWRIYWYILIWGLAVSIIMMILSMTISLIITPFQIITIIFPFIGYFLIIINYSLKSILIITNILFNLIFFYNLYQNINHIKDTK